MPVPVEKKGKEISRKKRCLLLILRWLQESSAHFHPTSKTTDNNQSNAPITSTFQIGGPKSSFVVPKGGVARPTDQRTSAKNAIQSFTNEKEGRKRRNINISHIAEKGKGPVFYLKRKGKRESRIEGGPAWRMWGGKRFDTLRSSA